MKKHNLEAFESAFPDYLSEFDMTHEEIDQTYDPGYIAWPYQYRTQAQVRYVFVLGKLMGLKSDETIDEFDHTHMLKGEIHNLIEELQDELGIVPDEKERSMAHLFEIDEQLAINAKLWHSRASIVKPADVKAVARKYKSKVQSYVVSNTLKEKKVGKEQATPAAPPKRRSWRDVYNSSKDEGGK